MMNKHLWLGVLLLTASATAMAANVSFFVSPKGDDAAVGQTEQSAMATLQLALDRAIKAAGPGTDKVIVNVAEGTYTGQKVNTEGHPQGVPIVIKPTHPSAAMPMFDGGGGGGTWFSLRNDKGQATHISIIGMRVTRYVTAISLNGNRDSAGAFNSGNVIEGNTFDTIGQVANPNGPKSTAAIRLVNSKDNVIRKNHFVNIKNIEGCSALHSIYMASYSSKNVVEDNVFEEGCGQTIKVRDASNENVIRNNNFKTQVTTATFQEAYCNKDQRGDECTKAEGECPSVDNIYEGNVVSMKGSSKSLAPVRVQEGAVPAHCLTKDGARSNRVVEKATQLVK